MLRRIDGDLYIEQVPLKEIAQQHGTPTFVYSETAIRDAYQRLDDALANHTHQICYAVKANSNIAILQLLAELGAGFDIVSGGELTRVLHAGGEAANVVFSGVGKSDVEILQALRAGIGCFNVESASELSRITDISKAGGFVAPISIRVNPDVDANTHEYISTGLKNNKFGVSADEAVTLYQQASKSDSLTIVGIDCHIGSQITELEPYLEAMSHILNLVDQLDSMGIELQHIDMGGGLGICYRDETPLDEATFASAMIQAMGSRKQSLVLEPGRSIVGNAGLLLSTVNTLKAGDEKQFAIVDAAMNDLIRPALYNAWQDVVVVNEHSDPESKPTNWDIVGPVCESGDFLAKDRKLAIQEGDLIAVLSSGAYGFVMSSNYNSRGRAAEILVSGDQHFEIRRRETIDDLIALETLRSER